ncbi:unnamed protein product [Camellia sinensis]
MGALTPVFLFLLFLSANSDESSKLDSSCFSAIPISNSVAALYVFGDSTVDAGNNNYVHKAARANSLPYGIDFNNTPTGRFTNGKTIADFIGSTKEDCHGRHQLCFCWVWYLPQHQTNRGPLGCLPSVKNKTGNGQCDEQMNQNIMPYNSQLPQTLKNIQDEYPDATLTLANSHDLLQDILADTEKYDVKDPRCGTYVNGELACIPNSTPCDNRCQYLFFDASHTGEFANCIFV